MANEPGLDFNDLFAVRNDCANVKPVHVIRGAGFGPPGEAVLNGLHVFAVGNSFEVFHRRFVDGNSRPIFR